MYWSANSFGGVGFKNYIHVFAFEGDTITFGSNIYNSKMNADGNGTATEDDKKDIASKLGQNATVDIVLIDLQGNRHLYDVKENGVGHIPNVQTEVLAKTMESSTGNSKKVGETEYTYTPLTYKVTETGVYTFEFHSYDWTNNEVAHKDGQVQKNGENSDGNLYKANTTDDKRSAIVAAWDISVFNEQNQKETGRVYADYLSMQQNGSYKVIETYYAVTTDSYIYRWDWNGSMPNTYNFFTDNQGLIDNATGSSLYKSVKEIANVRYDYTKFGASYKYPGSTNTDTSKSYYIFFEMPNPDLEGYLYSKALQPDPAENIRFIDKVTKDGKEVTGAYKGLGGYFAFDTKEATTATLVLNFEKLRDKDGKEVTKEDKGKYSSVTISGPVNPYSTNYFYWDGKDGDGVTIPAGEYKIEEIVTLTTKAGEIHFPVHDMEYSPGGFTITRVSPIYDRNGKRLDTEGSILDATKSVIYYDDSAIYYGEQVGSTGNKEDKVKPDIGGNQTLRQKYPDHVIQDGTGASYYKYNNMEESKGGEWEARNGSSSYVNGVTTRSDEDKEFIRIGDHSHTTNMIEYYDDDGSFLEKDEFSDQQDMINYLDSEKYPVEKISTWQSAGNILYGGTTDYGIVDLWTFIPAQPATIKNTNETLHIVDGTAFNLTGRVFYDKDNSGDFDSMVDGDSLLSGVTLRLYRKTKDQTKQSGKTYYTIENVTTKVNSKDKMNSSRSVIKKYTGSDFENKKNDLYELYREGKTEERYFFTNIPYNNNDAYVYEVVRPNISFALTSGQKQAAPLKADDSFSGAYALYAYDANAYGTEVQTITVNNTSVVNPDSNKMNADNHTITAVDVGYNYDLYEKMTIQKIWSLTKESSKSAEVPVFELRYIDSKGKSHVYEERPLAKLYNLSHSYELLPSSMDGNKVKDWYIAAEYYILDNKLYKHTFDYNSSTGTYNGFIGKDYYINLTSSSNSNERSLLEDKNNDGQKDWDDLASYKDSDWQKADPLGTKEESKTTAKFKAVIDRNQGASEIKISIDNSDEPGVIEILKFTGAKEDKNYLSGATFRLYTSIDGETTEGNSFSLEEVKSKIASNQSTDIEWLRKHQVGSETTRINGRVAFAGLDPTKHYVLREIFAPPGYRPNEELYFIHPANCTEHSQKVEDQSSDINQQIDFYFGSDGYLEAAVSNIPANGDMAIRKKIDGRAWNANDAFTFNVSLGTNDNSVTYSENSHNYTGAIEISDDEYKIVSNGDNGAKFKENLKTFIESFNKNNDIIVNYNSDFAKNIFAVNDMQDVTVEMPDTKQSVTLIINDEPEENEETVTEQEKKTPNDAIFNTSKNGSSTDDKAIQAADPHTFPAAGTYTFTIRENQVQDKNLSYSNRVYTLVVEVIRKADPGAETANLTASNSYLYAEVKQIYYQEPTSDKKDPQYPTDYNNKTVYTGIAPTFTNTYNIQPAIQDTSYAIAKDFTGRLDENGDPINNGTDGAGWKESDKFSVTIEGADEVSKEALKNGNIYIGGLHGNILNPDEAKLITFNQTNVTNGHQTDVSFKDTYIDEGHTFHFNELDFKNIHFQAEWQFSDSNKLPQGYKVGDAVPTDNDSLKDIVISLGEDNEYNVSAGDYFVQNADDISENNLYPVVSRTQDIVYTLVIKETQGNIPGVTYDNTIYTIVITLKNAVKPDINNPNEGVTDGIIDEIDIKLYNVDAEEVNNSTTPIATCTTIQHVVTEFNKWINPQEAFNNNATEESYKKYYVGSDGVIKEPVQATKDSYNIEINGKQQTVDNSNFNTINDVTFIVKYQAHTGNHTITFTNTYSEKAEWTPNITKTLQGRDWKNDETFTFTITPESWPGKNDKGDEYKPILEGTSSTISQTDGKEGETYSGTLPKITFNCPGTYTFTVTEIPDSKYGVGQGNIEYGSVTLTVTAKSADGKLDLMVTADPGINEENDIIFEKNSDEFVLNFVNTYDESGEFDFNISKQLIGREWTDEEFTFTITPDEQAKADIENQILTIPSSWGDANQDGSYTIKIDKDIQGTVDKYGWTTKILNLGKLKIGNLKTNGAIYEFTIKENEESLVDTECYQPAIKLTINASSGTTTEEGYTGNIEFVTTYAYITTEEENKITAKGEIILPFINKDTRVGTITIKKKLDDINPKEDEIFAFVLTLNTPTYSMLKANNLKVVDNNNEVVETEWQEQDGQIIGTFNLHDNESVTISNIPYNSTYNVSEIKKDPYTLYRVANNEEDTEPYIDFDYDTNSVNGVVDGDVNLLFVNRLIPQNPVTGGLSTIIYYIIVIWFVSLITLLFIIHKRRKA